MIFIANFYYPFLLKNSGSEIPRLHYLTLERGWHTIIWVLSNKLVPKCCLISMSLPCGSDYNYNWFYDKKEFPFCGLIPSGNAVCTMGGYFKNSERSYLKFPTTFPAWYLYSISFRVRSRTYRGKRDSNPSLLPSSGIGSALDIPKKTIYISFSVRLIESTKTVRDKKRSKCARQTTSSAWN